MANTALPEINKELCTLCGTCVSVCPEDALAMGDGEVFYIRPEHCTYCTACEEVCPENAITCGFQITWK